MSYNKTSFFLIALIVITSSLGYLSIDLYLPSLPAMTKEFLVKPTQVQSTLTSFLISFCFSQLFYGPLSDMYGRRPILLMGLIIYGMGTICCIQTRNITGLLVGRFFQGLGIGAGAVLARSMLRDQFSGNMLAQMGSYLNIGVSLATTISPLIGGFIQSQFGYRGNFAAMFLLGIIVLFLLWIAPETNENPIKNNKTIKEFFVTYILILRKRKFVWNAICGGMALSALIIYSVTNPFLIQTVLGLSPQAYGMVIFIIALSEVIGSLINGSLVNLLGIKRMLFLGFLLMLSMSFIMMLYEIYSQLSLLSILLPLVGVGVGIGIIFPNASAEAFAAFDANIGAGTALYGFIQLLVTASISFIISELNIRSLFGVGGSIAFVSFIGLIAYIFSNDYLQFIKEYFNTIKKIVMKYFPYIFAFLDKNT